MTEAQHREPSSRKAWRPDERTEMVYARGTLLRRLFMDHFIQSDFDTWCSSPIAWQLRLEVDQCMPREECDDCRVYRSPRSRVLARSAQKSPVLPSNADCEHWKEVWIFHPMFAGNTKGGVEVEPAVRRAAPSRNSNQRVGLDSLHALKDTHLATFR